MIGFKQRMYISQEYQEFYMYTVKKNHFQQKKKDKAFQKGYPFGPLSDLMQKGVTLMFLLATALDKTK